ncbi:MAG: hypothetical protein WKF84_05290 [Pyrinomonadaceae bacterium]
MIIGGTDAVAAVGGAGATVIADAFRLRDLEISRRGTDIEVTGYLKG